MPSQRMMDVSVRQELNSLVEELTHSGAPLLSEEPLKKLKRICKTSDIYTRAVYKLVMEQLVKQHAEIRLSSFQIINELFTRSHIFRELLISDFQKFARLVTETDPHHPLPPPKPAAGQLKEKSLLAIRNWNAKFGEGYPKLKLGFNYLKYNKKVDFEGLVAQSEAVRRRQEEREARQRALLQQTIQLVKQEMRELKYDMEECLTQMDACFNLLIPRFDLPDLSTQLLTDSSGDWSSTSTAMPVRKEERRRRATISSGSFASLSNTDEECGSDDEEEEDYVCGREEEMERGRVCGGGEEMERGRMCVREEKMERGRVCGGGEEMERGRVCGGGEEMERGRVCGGEEEMERGRVCVREEKMERGRVCGGGEETERGRVCGGGEEMERGRVCGGEEESECGLSENVTAEKQDSVVSAIVQTSVTGASCFKKGTITSDTKGKGKAKVWPRGGGELGDNSVCEGMSSSSDDSDVEWEDVEPGDQSEEFLHEHGFASRGITIPIEISSSSHVDITETEDNSSILATLRESHHLLTDKYLPAITRWMEWLMRAGEEESLRAAIDLKNKLLSAHEKYCRLDITLMESSSPERINRDEEEEGMESGTVRQPKVTSTQWRITDHSSTTQKVELELDPTTPQAQIAMLRKKVGLTSSLSTPPATGASLQSQATSSLTTASSSKEELRNKAPVVPFGMDLFHWGSTDELEPTMTSMDSLHRYWAPEHEVLPSEDAKAQVKYRTITFMGKFEPVKWACRAPLPSGKLCPRRDRFKCPLHGPIVARDEFGNPVDVLSLSSTLHPSSQPSDGASVSWNSEGAGQTTDKELEAVSSKKEKKRKGKKKKFPGLTDLKAQTDTPRKRLERKVLNKKSVKRVTNAMDEVNRKKYHDKFAYNFNYALRS